MVRDLLRVALGFSLLFGGTALAQAAGTCACGRSMEQCQQQGCACARGEGAQCALHRGKGAMGLGGPMKRLPPGLALPAFDPKTVGTFKGTITAIDRVEHRSGMVGVHLRVQAGTELLVVHLGPAFFVDPKMTFAVNDELQFTGSKLTFNGESIVLAISVSRGGRSLELRKGDGTPLFRGPRP